MKIALRPSPARSGYTLIIVLLFATVSFLLLSAALNWCQTGARLTERNNQYQSTVAAAEAATEKVIASMTRDFQSQGESLVYANLGAYRLMVPAGAESPVWNGYAFNDAQGNNARTYIERTVPASGYVPLQSQYTGLYGLASTYRVVSNARLLNAPHDITSAVKQDVQLASIPIFQFAIFYNMDLEINPGPNMNVTGRVHGNANLYTQPVNTLTFQSHVTAAGDIVPDKHPLDPVVRSPGTVVYQGEHDEHTSALTLPIGTNNTPAAVHAIVEVPPGAESPASAMGKQRFYNKADMVVLVSNATVTVKSGLVDNFSTTVPASQWSYFVKTNVTFYNKREGKTVKTTEVDVSKLITWSGSNQVLRPVLGNRDVRSLYVGDFRPQSGSTESGVRLINGQTLPSLGLTVASPNPLYVKGHYNAPAAHLGTTNTSLARPAALIGDSINLLSTAWSDANSGLTMSSRVAADTTVNAALLGGIVATGGGYYSGGVEDFPRFLENWSGKKLAYNGSMVVLYYSLLAIAPWGGSDVYSPPIRQWTFDLNFLDPAKLPPGTPEVRALLRSQWATIAPGTTL